jgi:hypothetical protein
MKNIALYHKYKYYLSLWITFKGAELWITLLDIPALK